MVNEKNVDGRIPRQNKCDLYTSAIPGSADYLYVKNSDQEKGEWEMVPIVPVVKGDLLKPGFVFEEEQFFVDDILSVSNVQN